MTPLTHASPSTLPLNTKERAVPSVHAVANSVHAAVDPLCEGNEFLALVEAGLKKTLDTGEQDRARPSDTLLAAGQHLCIGGGGKRIRPLMVQLFGIAAGAPQAALVPVAIASELVHSASLLHDDVVDSGMFRRSRPTVNALWGNIVAVMAGDLLLTLALQQLATLDRQITFDAVDTVAEMTRATIAEVEARGDLALPRDRFRFIAEGKTGALFGFCGGAAAILGGKRDVAARFATFGRHLGVAFQIADDLKDLNGGDPGKPQFADIRSRTASLPILLAAAEDDVLRRRIKDLWAFGSMPDEKVREVGNAVLHSRAPRQALDMMHEEIASGVTALGLYASQPGGLQLKAWADKLAAVFEG